MKSEFPSLFLFVAIALGLFFVYALFKVGVDMNSLLEVRQSDLSSAFRFLMENKVSVAVALAVVVIAKLLAGAPGPVKG